jgi:hypothetical protein
MTDGDRLADVPTSGEARKATKSETNEAALRSAARLSGT